MASIEKRIRKKGIVYRVKIRIDDKDSTATFDSLALAKAWSQKTESAMRAGKYFATEHKHTLKDAIDKYVATVLKQKPKSEQAQLQQLKYWSDSIGHHQLSSIQASLIAQHRDELASSLTVRKTQRSKATVNRYLAALSHVFTVAVKEWGLLKDNPVARVTKMREPRGRVRFLSDDERARLLDACKQSESRWLYLIVVLALSTGARRMEILGLRWADVDLKRGVITLHDTKNGERRVLAVAGHALELLIEHEQARDACSQFVFPSITLKKSIDIRTPWHTAMKRAGVRDFRFHDLRHSAASYLAMDGASVAEIAEVLGHKTLQMVKRYSHLSQQHTASVVARMNKKIFGI